MADRFQFSLRRLFGAMTCLSLALALVPLQKPLVLNQRQEYVILSFIAIPCLVGAAWGVLTGSLKRGTTVALLGFIGFFLAIYVRDVMF